ncbi:MAG: DUF3054 domain-containing protein [Actinomycetota bacterium]
MSRLRGPNATPLAAGIDTAIVVAFAALGRRNHDEQPGLGGLVDTAWPFLAGLALGWAVSRAWDRPAEFRTGLIVWPVTVAAGMVLRQLTGDGTATSFIVVASAFLGAGLVGWRAIAGRTLRAVA